MSVPTIEGAKSRLAIESNVPRFTTNSQRGCTGVFSGHKDISVILDGVSAQNAVSK